jgi:hypothetical protein
MSPSAEASSSLLGSSRPTTRRTNDHLPDRPDVAPFGAFGKLIGEDFDRAFCERLERLVGRIRQWHSAAVTVSEPYVDPRKPRTRSYPALAGYRGPRTSWLDGRGIRERLPGAGSKEVVAAREIC